MAVRLLARTVRPCKRNSLNCNYEDALCSNVASPMLAQKLPRAFPDAMLTEPGPPVRSVIIAGRSFVAGNRVPESPDVPRESRHALQKRSSRGVGKSPSALCFEVARKQSSHPSGDAAEKKFFEFKQPLLRPNASSGSNHVNSSVDRAFGPIFAPEEIAAARSLCKALSEGTCAFAISEDAPAIAIDGYRIDESLCHKLNTIGITSLMVQENGVRIESARPADRRPSISGLTLPSP